MYDNSNTSIIIDPGSYSTKIGFSNNTYPLFTIHHSEFPSEIYKSKIIKNFENLEIFYSQIFANNLSLDPEGKSFIITESVFEEQNSRLKQMEIFFESFTANRVALVSDVACSFFSYQKNKIKIELENLKQNEVKNFGDHNFDSFGKNNCEIFGKNDDDNFGNKFFSLNCENIDMRDMNGLIIELGHKQSAIVPIVEGHIIEQGIFNYPINGDFITNRISENICELNPRIKNNYTKKDIFLLSEKIKHNFCKIELNNQIPKIEDKEIKINFKKAEKTIKINDSYLSSLNMYFDPQDYNLNLEKSLVYYIAKSINKCPFDVKNLVFKVT